MAGAGLKTIVNLRGGRSHGAWQLERDAAERHGVTIVDFVLRSREAPDRETLLQLPGFFESLAYPALAHCKSGADRAGLFTALYLLVVEKVDVARALKELSLRARRGPARTASRRFRPGRAARSTSAVRLGLPGRTLWMVWPFGRTTTGSPFRVGPGRRAMSWAHCFPKPTGC